jgi:hypothetical protein
VIDFILELAKIEEKSATPEELAAEPPSANPPNPNPEAASAAAESQNA